jgi:hypothetical protein
MAGFDTAALAFGSGDVCIESLPNAVDWPKGEGLSDVDWPNRLVDGAVLVALFWPKMLPVEGAVVTGWLEGAVVEVLPNIPPGVVVCCEPVPKRPPEDRVCWPGAELPGGGTLNILPLKPENPVLSDGWLGTVVFRVAKGFPDDPDPPKDVEKLKDDEPAPPEPKANGDPPF